MELRHLSILWDIPCSYYRKIIPPPLAPTLLASKIRLPFSCICCSVCLQSRETLRLSEYVAEFIPRILPWMPLWMAVWDALNLHMQCIYFAVCASWGYWHMEHVTSNGVSSLSPATTGCNGHVFWFLGILNTSGPIPSQHWAPKLDCRPLWRFVYLPSFSSPSTKKEPVNRSLLHLPRNDFPNQLLEWRNYPHFCLPAQYDPAGPSLKIKPFLTSCSRVWSLVL